MIDSADRSGPVGPRYQRVYWALRERLRNEQYVPGERLPNQMQLAQEFGVSFMTLRRAIELLEREGYLLSRHGLGTFAARRPGVAASALVVAATPGPRGRLRALVEEARWSVEEASSLVEAAAIAQQAAVDCLVADSPVLVETDGQELARLRLRRPGLGLILVCHQVQDLLCLNQAQVWPVLLLGYPIQPRALHDALTAIRDTRPTAPPDPLPID